jgi:hypothetical protein
MPTQTPAPEQLEKMLQLAFPSTTGEAEDSDHSTADESVQAWVHEAFRIVLENNLLDSQLTPLVRQLLPVAAAAAISEEQFLNLGEHPLHQLIDTIYSQCIGWHSDQGRSDDSLLAAVKKTNQDALGYLENRRPDFAQLTRELRESLESAILSSQRTQERVIETESGRLKALSARVTAGRAINDAMQGKLFSPAIAEFLQGCWFDSLQLILILQGPGSKEWKRGLLVTDTLIGTVQPFDLSNKDRRKRLFRLIPTIPRELRQLLVSLKRDEEALEAALAVVEDTHLGLLQNQLPKCRRAEPIDLGPTATRTRASKHMLRHVAQLQVGQWILMELDDVPALPVRLALKLEDYGQLLFVNRVGAKALSKSFEEFAYLIRSRRARPLSAETVFSRALLQAAENGPAAGEEEQTHLPEPVFSLAPDYEPDSEAGFTVGYKPAPEPEPEPEPEPASNLELGGDYEPGLEPEPEPTVEFESELELTADYVLQSTPKSSSEPELEADPDPGSTFPFELAADNQTEAEPEPGFGPVSTRIREQTPTTGAIDYDSVEPPLENETGAESNIEPSPELELEPETEAEAEAQASVEHKIEFEPVPELKYELETETRLESEMPVAPAPVSLDQLVIGSWVVLERDNVSVLCKLAVRIADQDMYLFVNNLGKPECELNTGQLEQLIEAGELSLVEEKSSFQDAVTDLVQIFRESTPGGTQE